MDRPPVARLAGVSHRYGASVALEAVDIALPAGFRHVRHYPNTSPHGFREFMRDRARVERLKGIFENYIGPVEGPNPNTLDL